MYYDHDAAEADRKKEETVTEQKPKESECPPPSQLIHKT